MLASVLIGSDSPRGRAPLGLLLRNSPLSTEASTELAAKNVFVSSFQGLASVFVVFWPSAVGSGGCDGLGFWGVLVLIF
ncbi:hypothetical protein AZI87_12680 [Bdellovibrio bacteriovorus]|uniref:Uncharacterized protein n=1 Tax=Bdellovibrio bacteriovorus TaxID=959 RepID=A0A162GA11_BDEBC|nr:hypothetical protein AZI87_12680 [Bdellovibrio bacteriovorus]